MEKEDLKVLNKGEEEEMVSLFFILHQYQCENSCFQTHRTTLLLSLHPSGAAGLPSVPLAVGPCGLRGAVYRGLPPPAALLDARVVRQIHLHPYHSP